MERVVYRHPMGRFEVVEREYRALGGNTYTVREAVLTPAKDARGFASDYEPVEQKVMPAVGKVRAARPQVTPDERREWVLMHRNAQSCATSRTPSGATRSRSAHTCAAPVKLRQYETIGNARRHAGRSHSGGKA